MKQYGLTLVYGIPNEVHAIEGYELRFRHREFALAMRISDGEIFRIGVTNDPKTFLLYLILDEKRLFTDSPITITAT